MTREGFEPEAHRRGGRVEVVLHACPYESTALTDPTTVCALHLGMAEGLAEGLAEGTDTAVTDLVPPRRAGCRLLLRAGPGAPAGVQTKRARVARAEPP
jgi:predicted ArsR family transcriptional regulator